MENKNRKSEYRMRMLCLVIAVISIVTLGFVGYKIWGMLSPAPLSAESSTTHPRSTPSPEQELKRAAQLMDEGMPLDAWEILMYLDAACPGQAEALERCTEEMYALGLIRARSGRYAEACELWRKTLDYRDSGRLYTRTLRMQGWLHDKNRTPLLSEDKLFDNSYFEHVYVSDVAYVVAPEELSESCRFFIYYPGGKDVEINTDFMYHYLMNPAEDTIAVFLRKNGLYDMQSKQYEAIEILEQAAAERGVFVEEIMVCGSSLGAYPAMQSAAHTEADTGIKVSCVLSLDAGEDWNTPYVLSRGQCSFLAMMGTAFYLFESPWVGTDRPAIKRMVDSGMDVTLVGCQNDQHERITYDAMGMGVIHWALGDRQEACPLDIYSFTKLS